MQSQENEFVDITHRLQEAHLAAQKTKDRLLVYLIERALFQAEKMAAATHSPSSFRLEESELSAIFRVGIPNG